MTERNAAAGQGVDVVGNVGNSIHFPGWSCELGDGDLPTGSVYLSVRAIPADEWSQKVEFHLSDEPGIDDVDQAVADILDNASVTSAQLTKLTPEQACRVWTGFQDAIKSTASGDVRVVTRDLGDAMIPLPSVNAVAATCRDGILVELSLLGGDAADPDTLDRLRAGVDQAFAVASDSR